VEPKRVRLRTFAGALMPGSKRSPGFRPVLEAPPQRAAYGIHGLFTRIASDADPACAFLRLLDGPAAPALRRR